MGPTRKDDSLKPKRRQASQLLEAMRELRNAVASGDAEHLRLAAVALVDAMDDAGLYDVPSVQPELDAMKPAALRKAGLTIRPQQVGRHDGARLPSRHGWDEQSRALYREREGGRARRRDAEAELLAAEHGDWARDLASLLEEEAHLREERRVRKAKRLPDRGPLIDPMPDERIVELLREEHADVPAALDAIEVGRLRERVGLGAGGPGGRRSGLAVVRDYARALRRK